MDHLQFSWTKDMKNAVISNRMDIRYFPGYKFVCPDKLYPKEAWDVRSQYSGIFPFSSNKNCQSDGQPAKAAQTHIHARPDKRFQPVCHECGRQASGIHRWTQRKIRDLSLSRARTWITCQYRKVFCAISRGICSRFWSLAKKLGQVRSAEHL